MSPYFLILLLAVIAVNSGSANKCFTCDGICDCLLNPRAVEKCNHHHSYCYTVKLNDGQIIKKGCAIDCLAEETYDQPCEMCRGKLCNSEDPRDTSSIATQRCSNSVRRSIGDGVRAGGSDIGGGVNIRDGSDIGGGVNVNGGGGSSGIGDGVSGGGSAGFGGGATLNDDDTRGYPQQTSNIGQSVSVNVGGGFKKTRHSARNTPQRNDWDQGMNVPQQQRVGEGVYVNEAAPLPNAQVPAFGQAVRNDFGQGVKVNGGDGSRFAAGALLTSTLSMIAFVGFVIY